MWTLIAPFMKKNTSFLSFFVLICLVFPACHKTTTTSKPATASYLFTSHSWFRTLTVSYEGGGGTLNPPGYRDTLSNDTFTIVKINDTLVSFPGYPQLIYQGTDSTAQTVVYDSIISGDMKAVLTYYYAKDSISFVYDMYSYYGLTEALKDSTCLYSSMK